MDAVKQMRDEVKRYIETANPKVVKMVHALLESDTDADWWDAMPEEVKADINTALMQANDGAVIKHEEVKQKYPQWLMK
jgi:hypothetical protein